jgi:hypothetical protein
MILVPDNNAYIILFCMFPDDGLDFDNPRAGGINNFETGLFKIFLGFWRNAVGPDQDCTGSVVRDIP